MIEADLRKTRGQRLKRAYQTRYLRECYGELVQIDGSQHDWFEYRGPKCTLLVYIDDATGQLMNRTNGSRNRTSQSDSFPYLFSLNIFFFDT